MRLRCAFCAGVATAQRLRHFFIQLLRPEPLHLREHVPILRCWGVMLLRRRRFLVLRRLAMAFSLLDYTTIGASGEMVQPGITGICCTTAARRWCLPLAFRHWKRQTYVGPRELVVVFSGPGTVADLLPSGCNVRLVVVPETFSLGEKHNVGADQASHPWLCKWDDDDWYAPRRLVESMRIAQMHDSEIVGTTELLFHELCEPRRSWLYESHEQLPWFAGNTMLFQKDLWRRVPFPDRASGVDTVFVWDALSPNKGHAKAYAFSDPGVCVLMVHGQTTGRKVWDPKPPEYRRWPDDIRMIVGSDLDAYADAFANR